MGERHRPGWLQGLAWVIAQRLAGRLGWSFGGPEGRMPAWLLLLLVLAAWVSGAVAAGTAKVLGEARRGVPADRRRGVVAFPVLPLAPLGVWGLAELLGLRTSPAGLGLFVGGHATLAALALASITRDTRRLRHLDAAEPIDAPDRAGAGTD